MPSNYIFINKKIMNNEKNNGKAENKTGISKQRQKFHVYVYMNLQRSLKFNKFFDESLFSN